MAASRIPVVAPTGQAFIATTSVVVIGFLAAYIEYFIEQRNGETSSYTLTHLLIASLLGVFYLFINLVEVEYWQQRFGRWAYPPVFITAIALAVTIQYLLAGSFAIWLVSMPLVGTAASDLQRPWSWLVYLVVLLGILVPIGLRFNDWNSAFFATLTFSPAILFVIIFVQLARSAGEAQQRAEQLTAQLEEANRQLSAYAVQAEELAITKERNRLAREIHDNLGHYLTVINVQIRAAHALLQNNNPQKLDKANEALEKAQQYTQEGLTAVRQSVSSLRDSPLGERPLSETIAALVEQSRASGIVTEFEVRGVERPLASKVALTLFRAAQEGMTNVRRHARASRIDLTIDYTNESSVCLTLRDNGVGSHIKGETSSVLSKDGTGFGLLGIYERAQLLGGRVQIESNPGKGFMLVVEIPVEE
jgi:signal transduction histidine kinase